MTFDLTETASHEIRSAAARAQADGLALRVAASRRDDGSVEFGMGFDEPREQDETLQCHGLQVLVGAPSRALLAGMQLDFVEIEPGRHDFVFAPAPPPQQHEPDAGGCGSGGCGRCAKG